MSDLIDHGPYFERKGLSVSLEPGGFVTEVRDYGRMRSPRADTATLEATMSLNELVFACIAVKATAARDPRLTVQVQKSQGGKLVYEEQPGHPFRSLIMRPNDRMTEGDLTRAAIVSWDVSNPRRFYAEKEYANGLLVGLHPLNPAMMRPKYSQAADRAADRLHLGRRRPVARVPARRAADPQRAGLVRPAAAGGRDGCDRERHRPDRLHPRVLREWRRAAGAAQVQHAAERRQAPGDSRQVAQHLWQPLRAQP
jgi:hypothetical protein